MIWAHIFAFSVPLFPQQWNGDSSTLLSPGVLEGLIIFEAFWDSQMQCALEVRCVIIRIKNNFAASY